LSPRASIEFFHTGRARGLEAGQGEGTSGRASARSTCSSHVDAFNLILPSCTVQFSFLIEKFWDQFIYIFKWEQKKKNAGCLLLYIFCFVSAASIVIPAQVLRSRAVLRKCYVHEIAKIAYIVSRAENYSDFVEFTLFLDTS